MQEDQTAEGPWEFGPYLLNLASRELTRDGIPVALQPRVFDLLVFLVNNRHRAVDKDEIQDEIWPGRIITETALTRAIMKARKAVGDDASQQQVIKTLHGHGYRFVAEVWGHDQSPVEQQPASPVPDKGRSLSRWWLLAVLPILAFVWFWFSTPTLEPGTRIAVLPVEDRTGQEDLSWTRLGLMSFASSMIETDGHLRVVPDTDVINLADNLNWQGPAQGQTQTELLDLLARDYGSGHVLLMSLENAPPGLGIQFQLWSDGQLLEQGTVNGDQGTELAREVVESVYRELLGRKSGNHRFEAVSADAFINEAYARGMDLSLQGNCADASQLFRVIIDQEPGLFLPRYELAECLRVLGQWQESGELLNTLVQELEQQPSSRQIGLALMTLGALHNRNGEMQAADSSYEQALSVASDIGDHELRADVLSQMAILADDRSNFEQADELINRSMLAYLEAGRENLPGQLWSAKANLNMSRGDLTQADLDLAKALTAYRRIGDRRREAMMINNTGFLRRLQGRLDEAEGYHLQSLAIREELGDRVGVGRIHNFLAIIYLNRGDYDQARESTLLALEVARESRDRLFEATALTRLADIELALNEIEAASARFEQARQIFVEIEDFMRTLQVELRMALISLRAQRYADADTRASRVLERAVEQGLLQPEVQAMELMADVSLARQDLPLAIQQYRATLERVRESSWESKESAITRKLASAYLDQQDLTSAEPLMGAMEQFAPSAEGLMVQARFQFQRGHVPAAVDLLEQARTLAGERWGEEDQSLLEQYQSHITN